MLEEPITVVIVEDHQMLAQMFSQVLKGPEIKIVGVAADRTQAIPLIEREKPRIVLMDIGLPDGDGIALTSELRQRYKLIDVIIVTASTAHEDMIRAIHAGAKGYVSKTAAVEDVRTAIRAVARGQTLFPQTALKK